ncbi:MAG TPA: Cys/Met metabolism pyridoxal-phosphate-dependent protein [Clostridiales bacterium]|jgi:cystathionine gamma-lyase|nr:Cys/Met metabolism pyridoxal-phosphate-dependent protein [Clostridiales bacterium]
MNQELMNDDLMILMHEGDEYEKYLGAVVPPIFMNSLHVFPSFEAYSKANVFKEDNYIYGRDSNPTTHIVERKIARLEHGSRALVFSSGMAATTSAIMATCKSGSHIICMRDVYQPVKRFLNNICVLRLNMDVTYSTCQDLDEFESLIRPNTSLIILESPATFVFSVVDLREIAKIAKRHGVTTFIDNTYCTPLFQKPLDFGIDISMHTLSKYLGGHSDLIGGALVSKDEDLMRKIMSQTREWFGGIMGPAEAWLVMRGMRTLPVRLKEHEKNATAVAQFLEANPKVKRVNYTGLKSHPQRAIIERQQTGHSGLMSFELNAPAEKAVELINHLHIFKIGCSWGGFESLALTPLYNCSYEELKFLHMTGSRGLIRLHCGLEGYKNQIRDLEQALNQI